MIDLHAHILPGIDDGPPDMDAAVAMARAAAAHGTRALAATPHVDLRHRVDPFELAGRREELAARLADEGIELELVRGGELAVARLDGLDDRALGAVVLGAGPWVLVECPFSIAAPLELVVDHLHARGFRVIVAHPERCPRYVSDPARLEALIERGAVTQITSGSFAGEFGDRPRRAAETMLERGLAYVLASDGHGAAGRPPDVLAGAAAIRARYGSDVATLLAWMTDEAPHEILTGAAELAAPPPPRPVGRLLEWWRPRR